MSQSAFNDFKWDYLLHGSIPERTVICRCYYCGLAENCYNLRYKICHNAHHYLLQFKTQLSLINYLLNLNLCKDVKTLIINYIYLDDLQDLDIPCLKLKQYQDNYLALQFTDLSIDALKRLIHERKLKSPKNKRKMDHIAVLQKDLYDKRFLWRGISPI